MTVRALMAVACVGVLWSVTARAAERPAAPAEGAWLTSLDKAKAAAKQTGKPILADFTGSDWCPWCVKLKAEVFDTKEFKDWAAKTVVLLELDFPRQKPQDAKTKQENRALLEKYGVKGFPTVLFLDAEGEVLGKSGYVRGGAAAWVERANKILQSPKGSEPVSSPTLDAAKESAKKAGKAILLDFTGSDWCGWCKKLKAEVFDTKEFKDWAEKSVVFVEVDFPQQKQQDEKTKAENAALSAKYGIEGYPTIVLLDAGGKKIGELGYLKGGPLPWIEAVKKLLSAHPAKAGAKTDKK